MKQSLMRHAALLMALAILSACAGENAMTEAPRGATPTLNATPSQTADPTASSTVSISTPAPLAGETLLDALDTSALLEHLQALQQVADDHGGNRATGTPGFDASVDYMAERLATAGYEIERRAFAARTNLIVERVGSASGVVMVGAHLDSVRAGPGINDNGSGVAALLVLAEALATLPPPERTIRFAFWDAEEGGAFGSRAYIEALAPAELDRIGAYLNLDMVGSPNAIRLVYAETDAAPGSEAITRHFAAYFESLDLSWSPIDLEGDSDHGPFIGAGIPTGGLFSGGIEPVTDAQAQRFGATAGIPADACSHRACDTIANVDLVTLEEMTRAVAHVLVTLALD